jgi:hypothetical protein
MTTIRILVSLALLALATTAPAQTGGEGLRGSTPPGTSQDGAAPSEGAITGGSILPGESGGVPTDRGISRLPSAEGIKRCYELSGTLRDQCLLQEQGASTGGTTIPNGKPAGPTVRDPVTAPPPQNPQ